MDMDALASTAEGLYPVLFIPKSCTTLETNCEVADDVFIDLNITSPDTEGNDTCIYSGFCNVKLVDCNEAHTNTDRELTASLEENQIVVSDSASLTSQSQVWIDPARSPYVYNSCNTEQEQYSIYQSGPKSFTVEHHNTYITQNVYNCQEAFHYAPVDEFEHKKFRKHQNETNQNNLTDQLYEDDEVECGVFLSKLPEEIWNEKESRAREELKYVGLQSENDALKQLMSAEIQSVSKQQKTILFLGHGSHFGETIQKIAINDPYLECAGVPQVDNEVVINEPDPKEPKPKKYQCDKCKQIFDQISEFKQHVIVNHKSLKIPFVQGPGEVKFMCLECGKNLKNQEKFEIHCLGHGDPELECNKCHKVFATKSTLRTHKKIHTRRYHCEYCPKSYSNVAELKVHEAKIHFVFLCDLCGYTADTYDSLIDHKSKHTGEEQREDDNSQREDENSQREDENSDNEFIVTLGEELGSGGEDSTPIPGSKVPVIEQDGIGAEKQEEISRADSIIAKVMSNEMFLLHSKKARRKNYKKTCDVCHKKFDRVGDLKRHLIEHVIRSTMAKNPVNIHGTLNIVCEVCQTETFSKIDKYKAHLREHAKLTLYKCTSCDKSFSDSSNFSKHKKIHGTTYFQCDLCHRKFNSKKMITQHMEYHNKNSPVQCFYCDKEFHFKSTLNKHIRCAHTREIFSRFRCQFCRRYFKSLKEKWDHEWAVHNVRKMIVDCMLCDSKFRKYSELKRHCSNAHEINIPPATKLLKRRRFS